MDYSELIDSESEYLTVKSEEFNRGYVYKNKLKESSINKPIITNQHTSSHDGELYKKMAHYMKDHFIYIKIIEWL